VTTNPLFRRTDVRFGRGNSRLWPKVVISHRLNRAGRPQAVIQDLNALRIRRLGLVVKPVPGLCR